MNAGEHSSPIKSLWAYVMDVPGVSGQERIVVEPGHGLSHPKAMFYIGDDPPHEFHAVAQDLSDKYKAEMRLIRLSVRSEIHTVRPGAIPFNGVRLTDGA